jgi:hypothetical protein
MPAAQPISFSDKLDLEFRFPQGIRIDREDFYRFFKEEIDRGDLNETLFNHMVSLDWPAVRDQTWRRF